MKYVWYITTLPFHRASPMEIMDPEFQVRNLVPGKEYEFRVCANNAAGPGEWAQTSKPIKAQPPPCK